jgi:hypothetical protein
MLFENMSSMNTAYNQMATKRQLRTLPEKSWTTTLPPVPSLTSKGPSKCKDVMCLEWPSSANSCAPVRRSQHRTDPSMDAETSLVSSACTATTAPAWPRRA